jgi:hypothetical protein
MSDDDEHDKILNTPLIEAGMLEEAAAGLDEAIEDGDLDDTTEGLGKVSAIIRKMLENTADLHGMDHERMCLIAIAAAFDMAQDARPKLQSLIAGT